MQTRRELLTATLATPLAGLPKLATKPQRPWAARAIELEPTEGCWADFEAFEEWWKEQVSKQRYGNLEELDMFDRIAMYGIICDLLS